MDVMQQSATEDLEKMSALEPSDKPYLKTGVFTLARHRILWLLVLMVSSMITGGILAKYGHAFAALPLLVTFIPMLTDTGGNAGSQSATLIIRGMALSLIHISRPARPSRRRRFQGPRRPPPPDQSTRSSRCSSDTSPFSRA